MGNKVYPSNAYIYQKSGWHGGFMVESVAVAASAVFGIHMGIHEDVFLQITKNINLPEICKTVAELFQLLQN